MVISTPVGTPFASPPAWSRMLLGTVLIFAGVFVLGDVMVATLISAIFIGIVAIIAGAFEIIYAFWTKGWGRFLWQIFLGILYVAFGLTLVSEPVSGALTLTFILGLLLVVSGSVRIFFALRHWSERGWTMLLSGVLGLVAGLVILAKWPMSGLLVLGILLGIDLIVHGVAWLTFSWRREVRAA